jgi:hypothetical protein
VNVPQPGHGTVTAMIDAESRARAVLQAQLTTCPKLPAAVHRAGWALLRTTPADPLLQTLVARADAPDDLVEVYRTITTVEVRVAFLARLGHTADFLTAELARENRAGVLSRLLDRAEGNVVLQTVVAAKFAARPTIALAKALLPFAANLNATAAAQILRTFAARTGDLSDVGTHYLHDLVKVIAADADLHNEMGLLCAGDTRLVTLYQRTPGVSVAVRTAILDLIEAQPVSEWHLQLQQMLFTPDLQPQIIDRIAGMLPQMPEHLHHRLRDRIRTITDTGAEPTWQELLARAADGNDTAACQVILHPAAPVEVRALTASGNRYRAEDVLAYAGELPEPVLDAVVVKHTREATEAGVWKLYADPAAAQIRAITALTHNRTDLATIADSGLDPQALRHLPWPALTHALGGRNRRPSAELVTGFTGVQTAALGDDPIAWEVYAGLAGDFDGTLGDLLDGATTAAAVAGPSAVAA